VRRRRRPLDPPARAEPSQTEIDQATAVVSALGKAEARGDGAANLNGMMIDAATTASSKLLSTGPAAAVCPPDMTDARPRVVELWDRDGQLGIDDVPIASRTCPGAPGLASA